MRLFFNSLNKTANGFFDDVTVIYSLRKPSFTTEWTNAVIRLRRSSDNDQKYVFFDSNNKVSLSSVVSNISDEPTSTTLGDWVGTDDAYVNFMIGLTPDNTVDPNLTLGQGGSVLQPRFISSGVIETIGGEPKINFLSGTSRLDAPVNNVLDSGNDFTILSVSNNESSNDVGILISTTDDVSNYRFDFLVDRRSVLRAYRFVNDLASTNIDLLSQQDNSSQRLDAIVNVGRTASNYINGDIQSENLSWTGDYVNDGSGRQDSAPLNGSFQEIIIYSNDKTSDLSEINNNINEYYNIY